MKLNLQFLKVHRRSSMFFGGVFILGLGAWQGPELVRFVRDQIIPKRFGVVEDGSLYRSGQISGRLIGPTLEEHGIDIVVDLTKDKEKPYQEAEKKAIVDLGIEGHRFRMPGDGKGSVEAYADALTVIETAQKANKQVLVHCAAGAQRTGGVIACYRVLFDETSPEDAIKEMEEYSWDPVENVDLLIYLNEIMPELVQKLHEQGVLSETPETLPIFPTK